jgi:VIT1/CCC1 family predicted Fe2+/Mn2+ transporter
MASTRDTGAEQPRSVPGSPGSSEASPDGQRALRLHAGIATIATILCAFVTVIFVLLGSIPLAVVFGVLTLVCLGILGWARARRRRGAGSSRSG